MHVILFDIDGTLLHTGGAGQAAFRETMRMEFGVSDAVSHVLFAGRTDRAIVLDYFLAHGIADSSDNWGRFVGSYPDRLRRMLPACPGRVLPGVHRILELLADRSDVTLGLLTGNLLVGARMKLGHYGIGGSFRFGGFGDDHIDRDSVARLALAEAERHLGNSQPIGQVVVVGDTPLDIRCGRAIGASVVAVGTGWQSRDLLEAECPDLLLDDLSDPSPLLELLD
jgi:phosphoglycolate phosphatase-like HAD superfamily hydrolase